MIEDIRTFPEQQTKLWYVNDLDVREIKKTNRNEVIKVVKTESERLCGTRRSTCRTYLTSCTTTPYALPPFRSNVPLLRLSGNKF